MTTLHGARRRPEDGAATAEYYLERGSHSLMRRIALGSTISMPLIGVIERPQRRDTDWDAAMVK